jgi:hypothetical protein
MPVLTPLGGGGMLTPLGVAGLVAPDMTTNLMAYYQLENTSWLDSSGRGNHLTGLNSPTIVAGKVGNGVQLAGASSQALERADNADLSIDNVTSLTVACWVQLNSLATTQAIWAKWGAGNSGEYMLLYNNTTSRFQFLLSSGFTNTNISATNFGAPSTGTLYYVVCRFDAVTRVMSIAVNEGTANSIGVGVIIADSAQAFRIGARTNNTQYATAIVDELVIVKESWSLTKSNYAYNGGVGRSLI